jgi:coenzyme PQQ precursor peptide PqqA
VGEVRPKSLQETQLLHRAYGRGTESSYSCSGKRRPNGLPNSGGSEMEDTMKWVKPTIEEVCIGLEINDYFPAEL